MSAQRSTTPVIWCDFGGVLTAPAVETLATFCARIAVEPIALVTAMRTVARRYGTEDIMEPLDTPLVDAPDWSREVERVLVQEHRIETDLSNFSEYWFAGRPANNELIEYLRQCKQNGVFVGMLSNMVPAFEPYWPKLVPPELFDDFVFSYQVAARKPDRKIYDLSASRAGANPASCVLIDDLPQNCTGAQQAGWSAVEFRTNEDALARIRDFVGI
jgi:putative hydrolase of the HAD superfamily